MAWQIRNRVHFLWVSSGIMLELLIHQIDECCWIKDGWPVSATGKGTPSSKPGNCDQNLDSYNIEYTFADGTKLFMNGRLINGCKNEFASYAHGTKGLAVISSQGHAPSHAPGSGL